MKKNVMLVGAGIAAIGVMAAGMAQAQSNVTIYGVADVAYSYSNGANTAFSGISSGGWSGSRVGFKGSEDLGNGLNAVFTLEYGTDIDSGVGLSSARLSYVGITSPYGTFLAGKQGAPSNSVMGRNSSFEITGITPMNLFIGSSDSGLVQLGGTMNSGGASRWNNSVGYQSPTYAGFSGKVVYSFGEAAGSTLSGTNATVSTTDNSKFGVGVSYVNGPFNVDAVYQGTNNIRTSYAATAVNQGGNINEYYLGAGYDFKVVKIVGSYQQLVNNDKAPVVTSGNTLTGVGAKVWNIGAIYPLSEKGKVRAEYTSMSFDQSADSQPNAALRLTGKSTGWALGYTYDMSKRTMLYTSYGYVNNDSNSLGMGAFKVGSAGASNYSIAAGIKHSF